MDILDGLNKGFHWLETNVVAPAADGITNFVGWAGEGAVNAGAFLGIPAAKDEVEKREQKQATENERFSIGKTILSSDFEGGKYSSIGWLSPDSQSKGYWADMCKEASADYDEMYDKSLNKLKGFSLSDEQRKILYNAAVSDNYANDETKAQYGMSNVTIDARDGHAIDWSETQTMKKTKLSDGKFTSALSRFTNGVEKDEFYQECCGGIVTFVKQSGITSLDNNGRWFGEGGVDQSGGTMIGANLKGQICHYEGYLGSFDFDTTIWDLGYYSKEMPDGTKVEVPCLHYKLAKPLDRVFTDDSSGIVNAAQFEIPEGLRVADYMFADTSITTAPDLSKTDIESAHGMFMGCSELTEVGNKDITGHIGLPKKLKDASWMFSDCTNLVNSVLDYPSTMIDARYMFQGCSKLGYSVQWQKEDGTPCEQGNGKPVLVVALDGDDFKGDDSKKFNFQPVNFANTKFLTDYFVQNMYDGSNVDVLKSIINYQEKSGSEDSVEGWANDENGHNNNYDRLVNGCWNPELLDAILQEGSRNEILKLVDTDSKGLSGVSARTNGEMSEAVLLTDEGAFTNDSTWAGLLQTDLSGSYNEGNPFGEFIDRGIMALGTFGLGKKLTGSTLIGAGLAGVTQITGFGAKLTPLLDGAADMIGNNAVGNFLRSVSNKLKFKTVDWQTKVEELNLDEVFSDQQTASASYAVAQMDNAMSRELAKNSGEVDTFVAAEFDVSAAMSANGSNIVKDGNLVTIALTSDDIFRKALDGQLMDTSTQCVEDKMAEEVEAAGGMTDEIREKYSGYFTTLLYNLSAYSEGAETAMAEKYQYNDDLKAKAECGLGKVMRNTVLPVYERLYVLCDENPGFLTQLQMDTLDKECKVAGLPTFSEYWMEVNAFRMNKMGETICSREEAMERQAEKLREGADVYVDELDAERAKFESAMDAAQTDEERDAAFKEYYSNAYQYLIDEAKDQGVVIDTKGVKSTKEKQDYSLTAKEKEAEFEERKEAAGKDGKAQPEADEPVPATDGDKPAEEKTGLASAFASASGTGAVKQESVEVQEAASVIANAPKVNPSERELPDVPMEPVQADEPVFDMA